MAKGKWKMDGEGCSRERTISWEDEHTKYMLHWYIEYKKNQHGSFVWKKQHHMKCADALNKEFAMGVTLIQVQRHYRHYKENWKIVETALHNSGNGFDTTRCKLIISESEKERLGDRARRLLCKPIKFFHEMQELFSGSNADGSLAMDQNTCLDDDNKSGSSDSEGLNDMSCYGQPTDLVGDDSDTLPSPKGHKVTPSATSEDNGSSSTPRASMKRKRGVKSPGKKQPKPKSRLTDAAEEISATMKTIAQALGNPLPAPQMPQLVDPHAALWQRLEALTISTKDKIDIGEYLASSENKGMRGFLAAASDTTLQTWVYEFICNKEGH